VLDPLIKKQVLSNIKQIKAGAAEEALALRAATASTVSPAKSTVKLGSRPMSAPVIQVMGTRLLLSLMKPNPYTWGHIGIEKCNHTLDQREPKPLIIHQMVVGLDHHGRPHILWEKAGRPWF